MMKKRVRCLTGILLCCGLLSTTAAAAEVSGPEAFQGELRLTLEETNIADLAMFSDMGLALSIREDGSLGELVGSITGSGTNLLTGRVVQDGEEVLFLLPELTETVFSLNMAEYGEMMEKMQEILEIVNNFAQEDQVLKAKITGYEDDSEEDNIEVLDPENPDEDEEEPI